MRLQIHLLFAALLSASALCSSCASSDPNSESSVSRGFEISGGRPDAVDSNVFLLLSQRGSTGTALCTASLIAPNLLLTARHCVSDVTDERVTCGQTTVSAPLPVNTLLAVNAASADDATVGYHASSVSVPSEGNDVCGFDLALITLTSNVPASVATPLVPRIDREVAPGERYIAIGYGLDTEGGQGRVGVRRARAGLAVTCIPGKCGTGIEADEFGGQAGICSGDSGGPALDGTGKIVGVVSRSGGGDCAHPVYGSVASWKGWLSQVAAQAAEAGGYSAPFWVETGRSDAPASADGGASSSSTAGTDGAPDKLGRQGDKCAAPDQCAGAFACYSPSNSSTDAYCAQFCNEPSDCPGGTSCSVPTGVCVEEPSTPEPSGCAVHGPAASRAFPTCFGILAALSYWARKRRRASDSKRVY